MKQHLCNLCWFLCCAVLLTTSPLAHCQTSKENSDFKLAVNLYDDGMYDLAAEQLRNFISLYSGTSQGIEARFYLGLTYMKIGKYEDARQTFQNFALSYVDHPKAPEAWVHVAEAFSALGNDREAASAYDRVRIFHPKSPLVPEALLEAARLYRLTGDRDAARKALRTIVQEFPSSKSALPARLAIGELYAEEGQTELAEEEARRVSEGNAPPDVKASALFSLGKIQSSAGLFTSAESAFRSVTTNYKNSPTATAAFKELGSIAFAKKQYEEAIGFFTRVIDDEDADDSLRATARFWLGKARMAAGEPKEALKAFEKLLDEQPHGPLAPASFFEAGRAAFAAGNEATAIAYAESVLQQSNQDLRPAALMLAARASVSANNNPAAVRYYQTFAAEYRNHPAAPGAALEAAKQTEAGLHDPRKAIGLYDQTVQSFPNSPTVVEAMTGLARCQEAVDDIPGSIRTLKELIKRYPACDSLEAINQSIRRLEHHRLKDRDGGMEKLARLLGEVLTSRDAARLSLQLGMIYFNEMKDYSSAIRQLTTAIDSGLGEEEFETAYFTRAQAYDYLSELEPDARQKATLYYDSYLKQFPGGSRNDEARYRSYRLKILQRQPANVIELAQEFLTTAGQSSRKDEVLADKGSAELAMGAPVSAVQTWKRLIDTTPKSALISDAWLALGQAYSRLNKPDSAALCWNNALTIPGKTRATLQALVNLVDEHMKRKKYADAARYLRRIVDEYSYTAAAATAEDRLPDAYISAGKYDEAVALLRKLLAPADLRDGDARTNALTVRLAVAYERDGEKQDATTCYLRYIQRDPAGESAGAAYLALGGLARSQGKPTLAAAYFQLAATLGGTGSVSREVADLLFRSEQYSGAIRQYTQLAASDSGEDRAYDRSRIIIAHLRLGNISDARPLIEEFRQSYPKRREELAEFEYERGLALYRKQEYASARKIFDDLCDDYGGTRFEPWGYFYLAKLQEVSNKTEDAAKRYEAILKKYPDSDVLPRVYLSLGNMHFNVERFEEAIRYYQKIVEQPGKAGDILPFAMNNLIEAYESTKLYDNALQVTRDFLTRFPGDESLLDKKIKMGTLYTKLGYYDQAVLHFQNLIDEAGSLLESELRYNIGEALYNKGDYQQAILEFLKVPYLVSRQGKVDWTATSLYMAGQSYEKMSRFEEAIGMYQQIVDRGGIDATFKSAARKEIERVKQLITKGSK